MTGRPSLLAWLAATLLAAACSPTPEPQTGSESHFLEACRSDECASGLSCLCGLCTAACDPSLGCSIAGQASTCVPVTERGANFSCDIDPSGGFCDVPCASASDCAGLGSTFFCLGGFCRVDPLSRPAEPVPGFGALCEQRDLVCSSSPNPPTLVGSYAGQGQVVLSSNALWNVAASETLTVQVTQQSDGLLAGTIDLQSLSLTVNDATVRGDGADFSLYGSGSAQVMGCGAETRVLISGTLDETTTPATVSGAMALRFTGNFAAQGCTAEQLSTYPDTGANFLHSETRLP